MTRPLFDRIFGDDYARGLEAECARLRALLDAAETEAEEARSALDARGEAVITVPPCGVCGLPFSRCPRCD